MQLFDASQQSALFVECSAVFPRQLQLRDLDHQLFALGEKFMERRIQQSNHHWISIHRFERPFHILFDAFHIVF